MEKSGGMKRVCWWADEIKPGMVTVVRGPSSVPEWVWTAGLSDDAVFLALPFRAGAAGSMLVSGCLSTMKKILDLLSAERGGGAELKKLDRPSGWPRLSAKPAARPEWVPASEKNQQLVL